MTKTTATQTDSQTTNAVSLAGHEHKSVKVRVHNHNTGKTYTARLHSIILSDSPTWAAADTTGARFNADGKRHGKGSRHEPMTIVEILPW